MRLPVRTVLSAVCSVPEQYISALSWFLNVYDSNVINSSVQNGSGVRRTHWLGGWMLPNQWVLRVLSTPLPHV
jgi:hypothetical protein